MRGTLAQFMRIGLVVLLASALAGCTVSPPRGDIDRVPLAWPGTMGAVYRDVHYGPDPANVADIYNPVAGGNRGVIVLVHGGGFYSGTREQAREMSGVIMSQVARGFSIVNIDYRLVTDSANHFPAAVDDVSLAVTWVREHAAEYGMNASTVIVAGHSAGATLAALVGLGWNSSPSGALGQTAHVDGYISFAGVLDFQGAAEISTAIGDNWLGSNADVPGWKAAASPTTHLDRDDPPGYVAHGDLDNIIEMAQVDKMMGAVLRSGTDYAKLFVDRVTTGETACRWHIPQCGVNATELNRWLDLVVERRF